MFFDEDNKEEFVNVITDKDVNVDRKKFMEVVDFMAKPASGMLATAPSPRFIKTHLPMSLMPPTLLDTAKMVYVARDPRDVAVSCYHHARLFKMMHFPGGFKEFWNLFYKSLCEYNYKSITNTHFILERGDSVNWRYNSSNITS